MTEDLRDLERLVEAAEKILNDPLRYAACWCAVSKNGPCAACNLLAALPAARACLARLQAPWNGTLCKETGRIAEKGTCPVHGGDACLVYLPELLRQAAPPAPREDGVSAGPVASYQREAVVPAPPAVDLEALEKEFLRQGEEISNTEDLPDEDDRVWLPLLKANRDAYCRRQFPILLAEARSGRAAREALGETTYLLKVLSSNLNLKDHPWPEGDHEGYAAHLREKVLYQLVKAEAALRGGV